MWPWKEVAAKEPEEEPEVDEEEEEEEDEEELVDPMDTLREECGAKEEAAKLKERFEECNAVILERKEEAQRRGIDYEGHCQIEYFHYLECVDNCVAKTLFNHLK